MSNYYAVAVGVKKGVYTTWDECKENIENFPNARYKKFLSEEEANEFVEENSNNLFVYTDGSCINNGKDNARAGIGIYFKKDDARNLSKELTSDTTKLTNNIAELTSAIEAIQLIKKEDIEKKTIVTDSEYIIKCATTYGKKLEGNKWKTSKDEEPPNVNLVKKIYELTNKYDIKYKHIKAHTENKDIHSIGNYYADKLANDAIGLVSETKISSDTRKKIMLNVSYNEKDNAKAKGARWEPNQKKWYIYEDNKNKDELIKKYT
jgi:ribonuclease HI